MVYIHTHTHQTHRTKENFLSVSFTKYIITPWSENFSSNWLMNKQAYICPRSAHQCVDFPTLSTFFPVICPIQRPYLAGVFLLVDDGQSILRCLPLGLSHRTFHLGSLCGNHVMGFPLCLRHSLLQLRHCLSLHLVHSLLCDGRPDQRTEHPRVSSALETPIPS